MFLRLGAAAIDDRSGNSGRQVTIEAGAELCLAAVRLDDSWQRLDADQGVFDQRFVESAAVRFTDELGQPDVERDRRFRRSGRGLRVDDPGERGQNSGYEQSRAHAGTVIIGRKHQSPITNHQSCFLPPSRRLISRRPSAAIFLSY